MGYSSYRENLYKNYKIVYIQTGNGRWRRDFYLPSAGFLKNEVLTILFEVSSRMIHVHYENNEKTLPFKARMMFWADNGVWNMSKLLLE